jgi:hypothetical protein
MDCRRGATENVLASPVTRVQSIKPLSVSAFVLRLAVEFGPKTALAVVLCWLPLPSVFLRMSSNCSLAAFVKVPYAGSLRTASLVFMKDAALRRLTADLP